MTHRIRSLYLVCQFVRLGLDGCALISSLIQNDTHGKDSKRTFLCDFSRHTVVAVEDSQKVLNSEDVIRSFFYLQKKNDLYHPNFIELCSEI